MRLSRITCLFLLCCATVVATVNAAPQTSAFTYQGQLKQNGQPFDGTVNLQFRLFDDPIAGTDVAPLVSRSGVVVQDGIFTVEIDFGANFSVDQRWIEVIANGLTLLPRQPITATPMALYALSGLEGPQGPGGPAGPQGVPGPTGTPVLMFGGTVRQSALTENNPSFSYGVPSGTSDASYIENNAQMIVATSCRAGRLRVALTDSTGSYPGSTVTLMVNGAPSSVSCSVNAGASCSNVASTVDLVEGNTLSLRFDPAMPPGPMSNRQSDVRILANFGFSCSDPT